MLVENYSARLFVNERDYLFGFEAILNVITKLYNEHFIWNLPESYFSSALTWPTKDLDPLAKRRLGLHSFNEQIVQQNAAPLVGHGLGGSAQSTLRPVRTSCNPMRQV